MAALFSTAQRLRRPMSLGLRLLEDVVPCAMLAGIVVLVSADVFLRYVLNRPIAGSAVVATLLFVWTSFLGASGAVRRKLHVGFDLVLERSPSRVAAATEIVTTILIVLVLAMVVVFGARLTIDAAGRPLLPLDLSYAWLTAAIPTGAALMLLRFLGRLGSAVRRVIGDSDVSTSQFDAGSFDASSGSPMATHGVIQS